MTGEGRASEPSNLRRHSTEDKVPTLAVGSGRGPDQELPTDGEIWVHCQSGHRAAIAASVPARSGRTPVLVDDDAGRMVELGMELTTA